jgi:hypothetical protein
MRPVADLIDEFSGALSEMPVGPMSAFNPSSLRYSGHAHALIDALP